MRPHSPIAPCPTAPRSRRRRLLRGAALLAVAATLGLGAAGPSLAAGSAPGSPAGSPGASEATISHVEPRDDGAEVLVSVPPDSDVDLGGVSVTVDGTAVEATAQPAGSSGAVRRTAVLVVDTSNSMAGERFAAARQAALTFLDSAPDDVLVGVVAFSGEVTAALEPTLDRDAAREVVEGLSLSRDTLLYDGVLGGVAMAGDEGQRKLLVLSDGADTSDTDIDDVAAAVEDSGVLVDVIALEQDSAQQKVLQTLSRAGQGQVVAADSDALRAAFAEEADALDRQVLVSLTAPADLTATEAELRIALPTPQGEVVAEAFTTVSAASAAAPGSAGLDASVVEDSGWVAPAWTMYAGVGALGVGLVGLVVLLVPRPAAPMTAAERVESYTASTSGGSRLPAVPKVDPDQALQQAKDAAGKVLRRNKGLEARIAVRLDGAGSDLKAAEWLLVHTGVVLAAGLMGLLLGQGSLVVGLLFLALGVLGPWIYLGVRRSRRRKAFNSALPDTLQLMSGSLSAGLSLAQSVDTIVREGVDPVASEFRRVLVEVRLGVSLEEALESVAERFESKDFEWVVMAIRIQRQVGGNLAELLDTVAGTMREREYMRRQVAALAAEGKLSAWVLGLLPPLFLVYLVLTNGDYVEPMFTEPLGWLMLGGAGLILGLGVFWMSRLIKVEV